MNFGGFHDMKRILLVLVFLCFSVGAFAKSGIITAAASTCTAGVCVSLEVPATASGMGVALSGTFSGTVQFETSADGGTTWVAINGFPPNSTSGASSATSAGTWRFSVSGMTNFRVRGSSYASGTVTVQLQSSTGAASLNTGGGGGGTGCVPSGSSGDALYDDGAGGCSDSTGITLSSTQATLSNPIIGTIKDAANANILNFPSASTPVNYFQMSNSPTGFPVQIAAAGSDTNIDMTFSPKGSGATRLGGNLLPALNNSYDLGSSSGPFYWRSLYLDRKSVV